MSNNTKDNLPDEIEIRKVEAEEEEYAAEDFLAW